MLSSTGSTFGPGLSTVALVTEGSYLRNARGVRRPAMMTGRRQHRVTQVVVFPFVELRAMYNVVVINTCLVSTNVMVRYSSNVADSGVGYVRLGMMGPRTRWEILAVVSVLVVAMAALTTVTLVYRVRNSCACPGLIRNNGMVAVAPARTWTASSVVMTVMGLATGTMVLVTSGFTFVSAVRLLSPELVENTSCMEVSASVENVTNVIGRLS